MYDARETKISLAYLRNVVALLDEPICIIGGWAVYFTVNQRYRQATGRDYLGSRDIDLGFANTTTMKAAIQALETQGFRALAFRWWKEIDYETGDELSIEEAKQRPNHTIFPLYVDLIISKTSNLIRKELGFAPIDEPLLEEVFRSDATRIEGFGRKLLLPSPEVLLATKLQSHNDREKQHKRVKDLCDIIALLLYAGKAVHSLIAAARKRSTAQLRVDENEMAAAAATTGITIQLIRTIVREINESSGRKQK